MGFFQIAQQTIYCDLLIIHMKKLCSHVRKSHLEIKKIEKFGKKRKLRKIKKFALYFFFCTVFRENCTALSQSELRIVFMYTIKAIIATQ